MHVPMCDARGPDTGRTLPTAASPSSTSLTLLLGFGVFVLAASDMTALCVGRGTRGYAQPGRVEVPDFTASS